MKPPDGENSWSWLSRVARSTRWSLVRRMRRRAGEECLQSADEFCRSYWYPLYAYARHAGYSQADSQDHVQSFLARVLEDDLLAVATPEKGRLRGFLITLLNRHIAARRERDRAQKRGGGVTHVPLEWEAAESSFLHQSLSAGTPEETYRRALATRLVADGIEALRQQYREGGRLELFEALLPALEGKLQDERYETVAGRLGMRSQAVRMAAFRLRERFRDRVKERASSLLGMAPGPRLDEELREVFCATPLPPSV